MGLFFILYIMSIILTLSCSDWFLIWLGLELNMMSFIALVYSRDSMGVEASMKYFFVQSLGSGILMMMFYSEFKGFDYLGLLILSYKMGGGPFFFWFPSVCDSIGWGGCFLLMTVQKVLPLMLISLMVSMFLWIIIISSVLFGAVGSFNQKSLKRLMAYSSVHHIGWILVSNYLSHLMWMVYLGMYALLISGIVMILWKEKILEMGFLKSMSSKWSFVMGMLSLGGMPPMLGFYLKWWLFYNLLLFDGSILFLMVLSSVLMFYVYLRLIYSVFMGSVSSTSWVNVSKNGMLVSLDMLYMMGVNVGLVMMLVSI